MILSAKDLMKIKFGDCLLYIIKQIITKHVLLVRLLENLLVVHLAHFVKESIPELHHDQPDQAF
jgi:hypothetical protein